MTNHSYDIRRITQRTYLQRFQLLNLYTFLKRIMNKTNAKNNINIGISVANIRCKGLIIRVKAGETNYGIQYGRVVSIFC